MIKTFLMFLKNKKYFLWLFTCLTIFLIIFSPLLVQTENFILEKMIILDTGQLVKSMILPICYINSNGVLLNICSDIIFYLMLLYPISTAIEYFLKDSNTVLLPKLGRKKWIKNLLISEFLYCITICFLYVMLVLLLLLVYNYDINISFFDLLCVIVIKIIIGLLSIYVYTLLTLCNDDTFYSMITSVIIFFIINIFYYFVMGMNNLFSLVILIMANIIFIIFIKFLCNIVMNKIDL